MNITYIAAYKASFPSRQANSIHMMRMCEALSELGHEVTLYIRYQGSSIQEIFNFYGIEPHFTIIPITSYLPKIDRIEHALKSVFNARKGKVDLIVSRSAIPSALAEFLNIQFVFDAHGPVWEKNIVEQLCFKKIIGSKNIKKMTVNSAALKQLYVNKGLVPECGILVANNGAVISQDVKPDITWPGRQDALQVGYTGHLYQGRGVDIVLKCAEVLSCCDFHLIGGTDDDIDYWKSGTDLPNVFFHGFVRPSEVTSYRQHCDLLLAPYQSSGVSMAGGSGDQSSYMNPIKVIEYMSSGKAIIASDIPAVREVIPSDAALFAVPHDYHSWVSCIERMMESSFRESMAKRSSLNFNDSYTWQSRAKKLIH